MKVAYNKADLNFERHQFYDIYHFYREQRKRVTKHLVSERIKIRRAISKGNI